MSNREKFTKSLAKSNSVSHRMKKKSSLKRNNNSSSFKHLFNINEGTYVFNEDIFDVDRILSQPSDSASGSVVYLLKTKNPFDNNRYICKISLIKNETFLNINDNFPNTEIKIYKIMNILVDNYITPHVFKIMGNLKNVKRDEINQKAKDELKKYYQSFRGFTSMINETASFGSKIIELQKFIHILYAKNASNNIKNTILENILFQIVYTLEAFNIIGIKHNDIHFGNVFIIENERNILNGNIRNDNEYYSIFNREYSFGDSVTGKYIKIKLENIGFDVRIYDFDRSCKQDNDFKYYKSSIKSSLLEPMFSRANQNNRPNQYIDIFKVLMHFIYLTKYLPSIFVDKIKSFFRSPLYLPKYEYNSNKSYSTNYLNTHQKLYNRYFILRGIPKDANDVCLIKNTQEILKELVHLDNKKTNIPTLEKYSIQNINRKTLADYNSKMKRLILKNLNPKKPIHNELVKDPRILLLQEDERCSKYNNKSSKCRSNKCYYNYKSEKCIPLKNIRERIRCNKYNNKSSKCRKKKCFYQYKTKKCIPKK